MFSTTISRVAARMVAGVALLGLAGTAMSGVVTTLDTVRIASGLTLPLHVAAPRDDFARIFIVEQRGSAGTATRGDVKILNLADNSINATPFLSVTGLSTSNEEGLLGLAFHPNYSANGKLYVYYISGGNIFVREYVANGTPLTATTASIGPNDIILTTLHPTNANHNGGWLGFGPDGYLYIAHGDGGSGNDPPGNAQNINANLGKILRIDVNSDAFPGDANKDYAIPSDNPYATVAGNDEIWAYGVRNSFRNSFDRATGEFYIGDVGQDAEEEISWQPANTPGTMPGNPGYMGGRNYGWKCYEGNFCKATNCAGCPDAIPASVRIAPIATFRNSGGGATFGPFNFAGCSVTGGYVYRGCAIPDLQGTYFFSDYCAAQIWSFRNTAGTLSEINNRTAELVPNNAIGTIGSVTSFGEDAFGEMYIVDQGGEVFKIIPVVGTPLPADCNLNLRNDACDILAGTSLDVAPANGIPDECEVPPPCDGDTNGDGQVNSADLSVLLSSFGSSVTPGTGADFNDDGFVNSADLSVLLGAFGSSC